MGLVAGGELEPTAGSGFFVNSRVSIGLSVVGMGEMGGKGDLGASRGLVGEMFVVSGAGLVMALLGSGLDAGVTEEALILDLTIAGSGGSEGSCWLGFDSEPALPNPGLIAAAAGGALDGAGLGSWGVILFSVFSGLGVAIDPMPY